jgi:hypothetical protein
MPRPHYLRQYRTNNRTAHTVRESIGDPRDWIEHYVNPRSRLLTTLIDVLSWVLGFALLFGALSMAYW